MYVPENAIIINQQLHDLIFGDFYNATVEIARKILPSTYKSTVLVDFYTFNILMEQGGVSSLKLSYEFMSFLSSIKNQFVISGTLIEYNKSTKQECNFFIPNQLIYLKTYNKIGVFIKKKLNKYCLIHGVNLTPIDGRKINNYTIFSIIGLKNSP